MKKIIRFIIVGILIFLYMYVYNIATIPDNVVLFKGENLNMNLAVGLSLRNLNKYDTAFASYNLNNTKVNDVGSNTLNLELFGNVNIKTVNVDVISKSTVIPLGTAIGMKLYTKGVLVVGMSEIENENKQKEKPYENSGIEEGDSIIEVNNIKVNTTSELIEEVNESNGNNVKIKYTRGEQVLETSITPVKSNNEYKIGLWVRDAAAGVGTMTFYEPETNMFMSLGHGIADVDTENIVEISNGELVTANILSIIKGRKNLPGEIRGTITSGDTIGKIYMNTNMGVYGIVTNKQYLKATREEIEVADRAEIRIGEASIICQLDNSEPREYKIRIEKIYVNNNEDNKSMLIKITDENLIEKAGGIIQGMSGAPILQNGKFVGAVTNVLVKDPTQGYAIFGDLLIKQLRQAV